jgi:hypothetical protein
MKRRNALLFCSAAALSTLAAPWVVRSPVAEVAEAMASTTAPIADAPAQLARMATLATGRHLGFDTSHYPGDDAMIAWRQSAPYEWVGFYLPSPCHRDDSWSGKRRTLQAMGYGLAVVYVGQQTWGKDPSQPVRTTVRKRVRDRRGRRHWVRRTVTHKLTAPRGSTCSTAYLGAGRGRREADDAIRRTAAEGFPRGTVIFLDIERMERTPQAMRDYYRAWTKRVLDDGRYKPGYYVHTHNAERVYDDVLPLHRAAGVTGEPAFWVAGNGPERFSHDREPTDVGHAFASVWQGILDRIETRNGVRIPIDVNVASVPSPSSLAAD